MRPIALSLSAIIALLLVACDKGAEPAPALTTDSYLGATYDAVVAQQLPPSFSYDSTRFTYKIRSDATYEVDVLVAAAMGNQKVETGIWAKNSDVYTFTPQANWASNSTTHLMETADTLRAVHTGTTNGSIITINNFINIGNKTSVRNLGAVIFHKQ